MESIYQFNAMRCNNTLLPLAQFKGSTLLIVNTASNCHLSTQLCGLEKLYQQYKNQGFTILAFPCNQFGGCEPLDNLTINNHYQQLFHTSFEVFAKVIINGPDSHPLFSYLKSHTRGIAYGRSIKWNFTKFLINPQGQLIARYAPRTKPSALQLAIESNLAAAHTNSV
jgi:glutathione peroxidase